MQKKRMGCRWWALLGWALFVGPWALGQLLAAEVQVAVAANFAEPFQKIAAAYAAASGHKAIVITGSTGKFYTQIQAGAPFELLLAADQATPKRLMDEGLAVRDQSLTYARGKLVLWSAQAGLVDAHGTVLRKGLFKHLAVANPKLAPYGAAGMETLRALGLSESLQDKIVQGDNIAQTFQFIASGNAELGFVALSQVAPPDKPTLGSYWLVPQQLYTPILQDAVLLKKGADNAAARGLLQFLKSAPAQAIIKAYGYDL